MTALFQFDSIDSHIRCPIRWRRGRVFAEFAQESDARATCPECASGLSAAGTADALDARQKAV